jgi:hypothetical protein
MVELMVFRNLLLHLLSMWANYKLLKPKFGFNTIVAYMFTPIRPTIDHGSTNARP